MNVGHHITLILQSLWECLYFVGYKDLLKLVGIKDHPKTTLRKTKNFT